MPTRPCTEDRPYDSVVDACAPCADLCKLPHSSTCQLYCPGYSETNSRVQLSEDNDVTVSSQDHAPIATNVTLLICIGAITTLLILAVTLTIALIYCRRHVACFKRYCKRKQHSDCESASTHNLVNNRIDHVSQSQLSPILAKLQLHAPVHSPTRPLKPSQDSYDLNVKPTNKLDQRNLRHYTGDLCLEERSLIYRMDSENSDTKLKQGVDMRPDVCQLRASGESTCQLNIVQPELNYFNETSIKSPPSSSDNIGELYGWLSRQTWITEYRNTMAGVTEISIRFSELSVNQASQKIQHVVDKYCPGFRFRVTSYESGQFEYCPLERSAAAYTVATDRMTSRIYIFPGATIHSQRLEADPQHGGVPTPGSALYGGTLQTSNESFGITVGHLFHDENLPCELEGYEMGICSKKYDTIDLPNNRGVSTADLALIKLKSCVVGDNRVKLNDQFYQLTLYKHALDVRKSGPVPVLVICNNGLIARGQIIDTMYTLKSKQILNTIAVVDCQTGASRVTDKGDSGALVVSLPDETNKQVSVFGMVFGYYESKNTGSVTVASRLWDALREFGNDLEFCKEKGNDVNGNLDSAYFSM